MQKAADLAPADPEYLYNLGLALKLKDDLQAAVAQFQAALKLDPRYTLARRALGLAFRQMGELQPALVELRRAVGDRPDDAEVRHSLGTVLFKLNDLDGAINQLTQATKLDPLLSEAHVTLAQALQKSGRKEEARREMSEAERIMTRKSNAGRALVVLETATNHAKAGDLKAAIVELREAISLNPELLEARLLLASTLRQSSVDSPEIVKELMRVLELNPRHASAHYQLGLLFESRGKFVEAAAEYNNALMVAPGLIEARRALGNVAMSTRDFAGASLQFRTVVSWRREDTEARFDLGRTLAAKSQ
jgi:superkiller protein 3